MTAKHQGLILLIITLAFPGVLCASEGKLVNYNLNTMRGYGKCTVELENAPLEFFHQSFDGNNKSGFAIYGKGVIKAHLPDPIEIHAVKASFFAGTELGGAEWKLIELDKDGKPVKTLFTHKTTFTGKRDEAVLDKPATVKDFSFEFTKLMTDLTPAPKGKEDFRLGVLEIMVPNQPMLYVATPNEKWLFEPGFYPFEAGLGRKIEWTGWDITSRGARTRTVKGVKFISSNKRVAVMNGSVMRTLRPGNTTIRAEHPLGMSHEVPVTVLAKGQGGIDIDVIRLTRLVLDEKTGQYEILPRGGQKEYPIRGDKVRYRAEVVNLGQDTAEGITVEWTVDGKGVKSDKLASLLPAGPLVPTGEYLTPEKVNEIMELENRVYFDFDTVWQEGRQYIGVTVQAKTAAGNRGELNTDNNEMTIATDSLCFAYYTIELGYHWFTNAQQEGLKAGGVTEEAQKKVAKAWGQRAKFWREDTAIVSSSIYDYITRTCRAWDEQCELSKYPLTPNGITTRFRPKVVLIRDPASAWQAWGEGGGRAVWADKETDVAWGWVADATFPWDNFMNAAWVRNNYTNAGFLFFDPPMMHEASHARGLVDAYIIPMKNNEVSWRDANGNRLWPDDRGGICSMRERWTRVGYLFGKAVMMDGGYIDGYSEHSAYTMERMATKRGRCIPCNNCSGNASFGDSFNDVAQKNIIEIWTKDGKPVVGAKVDIAKRVAKTGFSHEEPDIVGETDGKGQFNMGNNPVSWPFNTAPVSEKRPFATTFYQMHHRGSPDIHATIRITTADGKRYYKFLNACDLNLAYWYKYGLEPYTWPIVTPQPYSSVVVAFTIDTSLTEKEAVKMENSGEMPTFGIEIPFEGKHRPDYVTLEEWRKARDSQPASPAAQE